MTVLAPSLPSQTLCSLIKALKFTLFVSGSLTVLTIQPTQPARRASMGLSTAFPILHRKGTQHRNAGISSHPWSFSLNTNILLSSGPWRRFLDPSINPTASPWLRALVIVSLDGMFNDVGPTKPC